MGVLGTGFFGNKNPPYPSQRLIVKCKLLTCRAPSKPRRSPEVKEVPPGTARNAALSCESTGAPGMPPPKNCRKAWFWGGCILAVLVLCWCYTYVRSWRCFRGLLWDDFTKMFHCLSEVEKGKVKGWLLELLLPCLLFLVFVEFCWFVRYWNFSFHAALLVYDVFHRLFVEVSLW